MRKKIGHRVSADIDQTTLKRSDRVKPSFLREALRQSANVTELPRYVAVSVLITTDAIIKEMNRDFRGIDAPTDVLSFSLLEGEDGGVGYPGEPLAIGQLVISLETTRRQAQEDGVSERHMLAWLISHGVLHLTGMDHPNEPERQKMRDLERRALMKLGFSVLPHHGRGDEE